jgi:hypothetical protein
VEGRGQLHALATFPLREFPAPSGQEVEWATELVWMWWQREKFETWSSSIQPYSLWSHIARKTHNQIRIIKNLETRSINPSVLCVGRLVTFLYRSNISKILPYQLMNLLPHAECYIYALYIL